MQDIHCHILPGVDDGSPNLDYSLKMLEAAQHSGITSIICTPHCRDPYFDYERMQHAFQQFKAAASGFPIYMGFEVNHTKLMQLGVRKWAPYLLTPETGQFLLELDTNCTEDSFAAYERTIYIVQGLGYRVVIAHPERYVAIRKNIELAQRLVDLGCELQASGDFIHGGRLGHAKRIAKKLFERGLYTYIASDAHRVKHYALFERAVDRYGDRLANPRRGNAIL